MLAVKVSVFGASCGVHGFHVQHRILDQFLSLFAAIFLILAKTPALRVVFEVPGRVVLAAVRGGEGSRKKGRARSQFPFQATLSCGGGSGDGCCYIHIYIAHVCNDWTQESLKHFCAKDEECTTCSSHLVLRKEPVTMSSHPHFSASASDLCPSLDLGWRFSACLGFCQVRSHTPWTFLGHAPQILGRNYGMWSLLLLDSVAVVVMAHTLYCQPCNSERLWAKPETQPSCRHRRSCNLPGQHLPSESQSQHGQKEADGICVRYG